MGTHDVFSATTKDVDEAKQEQYEPAGERRKVEAHNNTYDAACLRAARENVTTSRRQRRDVDVKSRQTKVE